MFPWHTDDCDLEFRYYGRDDGSINYWCRTHNQWTTDFPTYYVAQYNADTLARVEKYQIKNSTKQLGKVVIK